MWRHRRCSRCKHVSVAWVDLPIADEMEVIGVVLDRRLAFHKQVLALARSCNYHTQAIWCNQHLLTMELAQTLACSLILSRIDYCNAVLHSAPSNSIKRLQQVQSNAARIILEAPRRSHTSPLLRTLHWLPIQQRIKYKVALLTFKVRSTSMPSYLRRLIQDQQHSHNLRSATTMLFHDDDFCEAHLAAYWCSALAVWNSLLKTVLNSDSVTVFKLRLKTFLFSRAFSLPFSQ